MKKIFIILCCIIPLILSPSIVRCEDSSSVSKDEHVPLTENRLKAIGDIIKGPQFNFQEVINLLKEDKFKEAGIMLKERIATIKNLYEKGLVMTDRQPKLGDCLTLSYFINIYLDNISGAQSDADFIIKELKFPNAEKLNSGLQNFIKEAKQDKAKFGNTIKQMSESIWDSKDLNSSSVEKAKEYVERGIKNSNQGNLSQAILDCTKAIEIDPYYYDAYYERGFVYLKQGNYSQAILDCTKSLEIQPNDALAYSVRGHAYFSQHNWPLAISDYTKAIEISPTEADPYYRRGVVYYNIKEHDNAWADVHKAESLGKRVDPGFIEALKKASGRDK